jgi:hypothetical protein
MALGFSNSMCSLLQNTPFGNSIPVISAFPAKSTVRAKYKSHLQNFSFARTTGLLDCAEVKLDAILERTAKWMVQAKTGVCNYLRSFVRCSVLQLPWFI